jgi:hypothetical protein
MADRPATATRGHPVAPQFTVTARRLGIYSAVRERLGDRRRCQRKAGYELSLRVSLVVCVESENGNCRLEGVSNFRRYPIRCDMALVTRPRTLAGVDRTAAIVTLRGPT